MEKIVFIMNVFSIPVAEYKVASVAPTALWNHSLSSANDFLRMLLVSSSILAEIWPWIGGLPKSLLWLRSYCCFNHDLFFYPKVVEFPPGSLPIAPSPTAVMKRIQSKSSFDWDFSQSDEEHYPTIKASPNRYFL